MTNGMNNITKNAKLRRIERKLKSSKKWILMIPLFSNIEVKDPDSRAELLNLIQTNPNIEMKMTKINVKGKNYPVTKYKLRWKGGN